MAKSISISPEHTYTTGRGESETVAQALAWVEKHMSGEDEETGEETGPSYTPGDLVVYAVRRLRALHKDGKRYAAGKLASRLYAPRLDNLGERVKAPKALTVAVETINDVSEKLHAAPEPKKATKKPTTKTKKAKP